MENISVFGIVANITATETFPSGFNVTEFADDADPFDTPEINIADSAMGPNGDLLVWSKPAPINLSINVIPGSQADLNLSALFEANRPTRNRKGARDKVAIVVSYADGRVRVLSDGIIQAGQPLPSGSSSGRLKTRSYRFMFEKAS